MKVHGFGFKIIQGCVKGRDKKYKPLSLDKSNVQASRIGQYTRYQDVSLNRQLH